MGHFGIGSPVFLSLLRPTEKRMHENGLKERIQSNPICSYSDFSKFITSYLKLSFYNPNIKLFVFSRETAVNVKAH